MKGHVIKDLLFQIEARGLLMQISDRIHETTLHFPTHRLLSKKEGYKSVMRLICDQTVDVS